MKKILDIIPPQREEKQIKKKKKKKKPARIKKIALVVFPLVLILIVLFSYFHFSKAKVEVWPRAKLVEFQEELVVDQSEAELDFPNKIIPGILVEEETTASSQFSASKIEKKESARGTIRVYNKTSNPITLVKDTRFMSASSKVFQTPKRITIPGRKYQQGEWKPGHIDIKVIAAEPGPDYNIESSKFSVPGLSGSWLYTKVYAESFEPIKGGFEGNIFQVTKQDLKQAEQNLVKDAKQKGRTQIFARNPDLEIISGSLVQQVVDTFSSAEPGMEVEDFNFQTTIKTKALGFRKEKLEQFVKKFINSKIEEGFGSQDLPSTLNSKKIYPPSLKLDFKIKEKSLEKGQAVLNLGFSAKVYNTINRELLMNKIKGKSLSEASSILKTEADITKARIKTPGWLKNLPSQKDKIKIEIVVE